MESSDRTDRLLVAAISALVVVIVAFAGYFGWTVYRDRQQAKLSTPALRIIDALEKEIRKTPNDVILRVRLGEAYAAAGRTQDAIEQLNAGLKLDPKHVGALLDLGQIAMFNNRTAEARTYFNRVIELIEGTQFADTSDKLETAYFQMGRLSLSEKQYDEAIGYFKKALRIKRDASDSYYYLARALDQAGQTEAAIEQLQMAVAFDPNFAQAHYSLGQLYEAENDQVSASYHYARARRIDNESKEPKAALAAMGSVQSWLDKAESAKDSSHDVALDSVLIALNIDPEDEHAIALQAEIEKADPKVAAAHYAAIAKRDPSNSDAKAAAARVRKTASGK